MVSFEDEKAVEEEYEVAEELALTDGEIDELFEYYGLERMW